MITKTHEHCGTCDWLGREAERTAAEHQRDHWTSTTVAGATTHTAHFTQEAPVPATPTRYRKKPVSIEAMRFAGPSSQAHALTCWMEEHGYPGLVGDALDPPSLRYRGEDDIWPDTGWWIDPGTGELMIRTLEGDMRVSLGDWVIRGVQGEFYPCKPDIFGATYDPVDSDADPHAVPALHALDLVIEDGSVQTRFRCASAPDASCRRRPPDADDRESWTDAEATETGHPCWAVEWVEAAGIEDALAGDDCDLGSVPVHIDYEECVIVEPAHPHPALEGITAQDPNPTYAQQAAELAAAQVELAKVRAELDRANARISDLSWSSNQIQQGQL